LALPHYLLVVHRPASLLTAAVRGARHHIEANNVREATDIADDLIFDTYPKTDKAIFRLLDPRGLIATRRGEDEWCQETEAKEADPASFDLDQIKAGSGRGTATVSRPPR
jgi:hypothetical protein